MNLDLSLPLVVTTESSILLFGAPDGRGFRHMQEAMLEGTKPRGLTKLKVLGASDGISDLVPLDKTKLGYHLVLESPNGRTYQSPGVAYIENFNAPGARIIQTGTVFWVNIEAVFGLIRADTGEELKFEFADGRTITTSEEAISFSGRTPGFLPQEGDRVIFVKEGWWFLARITAWGSLDILIEVR